jgi:hypothetical protein
MNDEIDNLWHNAVLALPDVQPLVELLRRKDIPVTEAARELLALLLKPTDPPIEAFVLKPERNADWDRMFLQWSTVIEYDWAKQNPDQGRELGLISGKTKKAEHIVEDVGKRAGRTGRQILSWRKQMAETGFWAKLRHVLKNGSEPG